MLCSIVKVLDEVCVSYKKCVGENKTVLQLKQFAEVLLWLNSLKIVFKKKLKIVFLSRNRGCVQVKC